MSDLHELMRQFPAASVYLSEVFFQYRENGDVTNKRIAERLHVSPPAVTQAMKRLTRLDLVKKNPDGTIVLTEEGRGLAERIVSRHFILEAALVDLLGYPWDVSDVEADLLHPGLSPALETFLYEKLGRPTTCPHGNPLPGVANIEEILAAPRLPELSEGAGLTVVRITEEGEHTPGLLPALQALGIRPGRQYRVLSIEEGAYSLESVDTGETAVVSVKFAQFLTVRPA